MKKVMAMCLVLSTLLATRLFVTFACSLTSCLLAQCCLVKGVGIGMGTEAAASMAATREGAVYLRLSDDTQVAVERGSLEQQIHIAISEAVYRSEQERMNYRITEFYIEPGITGTHGNRPLTSLVGFVRCCRFLAPHQATAQHQPQKTWQ